MILSFRITTRRLLLYLAALMPFQTCCRVLLQLSCLMLPHMPWLSGVARLQANPVASAAVSPETGTAPVTRDGSVGLRQPSARTNTAMTPRAGWFMPASWVRNLAVLRGREMQLVRVGTTGDAVKHYLDSARIWLFREK